MRPLAEKNGEVVAPALLLPLPHPLCDPVVDLLGEPLPLAHPLPLRDGEDEGVPEAQRVGEPVTLGERVADAHTVTVAVALVELDAERQREGEGLPLGEGVPKGERLAAPLAVGIPEGVTEAEGERVAV
jgi:hypothetical protein